MNASGKSIQSMANFYQIDVAQILVVHDKPKSLHYGDALDSLYLGCPDQQSV
jgi:peptidyl-tRNA hydrolase